MEIDYDIHSEQSYITDNRLNTYQEFFIGLKSKIADKRNMLWGSDTHSNYTYLISNPMYVLDQSTYEIKDIISHPEKLRLESPENVLSFSYNEQSLILLNNQHFLYIFSLAQNSSDRRNLFSNGMYIEHRITFLTSEEYIVKMYNLENEINLPYLLMITSTSKIYLLKISFDKNFQFDYSHELVSEKVTLFRKLMSKIVSTGEISKIFILNPFNKFTKANKKNNILFLFNESYLKKIEFNVTSKAIEAELTFQVNPINLIIDKLKPFYKNSPINSKNITIDAADIYHDKHSRVNKIYFIVKYEPEQLTSNYIGLANTYSHFYLFVVTINHESNDISFNLVYNFSEGDQLNPNIRIYFYIIYLATNKCQVFLNKYSEEGFIFFSRPRQSQGLYFSFQYPDQMFKITVDYEFKGFSCINSPEQFSIDTLSTDSGVWNVYFSGAKICLSDKTGIFLKNVINSEPNYNDSVDNSNQWERSGLKARNPLAASLYYDDNIAIIDSNLDKILQKELHEFSILKIKSTNDQFKEHEINSFIQKIKNFEFIQIYQSITKILNFIVDDETLNVDNINKESIKAELVIIEYLREKERKLELFMEFLNYFKIFEEVDQKKRIFLKFLELKEKLIVATKLREFENNIIDVLKPSDGKSSAKISNEKDIKYYTVANNFFNSIYPELKNSFLKSQFTEKPFYKQMIFSKISEIHKFIETINDTFLLWIEDTKKQSEEKVILSYVLITLFNIILNSVRLNREKYFPENNFGNDLDSSIFEMRENSEMLWLLNPEYLKSFEIYLNNFLEYNSIQISTSTQKEIFSYSDNLLNLFELFHKVNFSEHSQKNYQNSRKEILLKVMKLNSERSLVLAKKYEDFYTITLICHKEKWRSQLKETMEDFKGQKKIILYILKLFLLLDSEGIRKDLNSQKASEFSFFENFGEFSEEMKEICERYPKLNFHYEIYAKSRNVRDHNEINLNLETFTKSVVNKENLNTYLKIAKMFNILNKCNYDELLNRKNEGVKFSDNFYVQNEKNGLEINFVLLINYLNSSLKLASLNNDANRNIFEEFPNFLINFIQSKSNNLCGDKDSSLLRYRIAIQIIHLAAEINYNFTDNEIFGNLARVVYEHALIDDYENMDDCFSKFRVNDMELLSDEQRKKMQSESILYNLCLDSSNAKYYLDKIMTNFPNAESSNGLHDESTMLLRTIWLNIENRTLTKEDFLKFLSLLVY